MDKLDPKYNGTQTLRIQESREKGEYDEKQSLHLILDGVESRRNRYWNSKGSEKKEEEADSSITQEAGH